MLNIINETLIYMSIPLFFIIFFTPYNLAKAETVENNCLILGDSIAKGISETKEFSQCNSLTKVGINSKDFDDLYDHHFSKNPNSYEQDKTFYITISLGSNDYKKIETKENLLKLRDKLWNKYCKVTWIIPSELNEEKHYDVIEIAEMYSDKYFIVKKYSKDKIHPLNYEKEARELFELEHEGDYRL